MPPELAMLIEPPVPTEHRESGRPSLRDQKHGGNDDEATFSDVGRRGLIALSWHRVHLSGE